MIRKSFGVVWKIGPSGLPLGLSCGNLTTPLTEIVPTACDVNGIIFGRGCPYGSNPNGYPGTCTYPAIGTPTTGTGSTTCISYYAGTGRQINANVTASPNVSFMDPVPGLLNGANGTKTTSQLHGLLTKERVVDGGCSDGGTPLGIRIDTNGHGHQLQRPL